MSRDKSLGAALNVLGYREDGDWVALALEMDLRGYGATFAEALRELRELVDAQVGFALFKGQPEMVWRPAEATWWQLFSEVRAEWLRRWAESPSASAEYQIAGMPIPPAHVIGRLRSERRWSGPGSTAS